MPNTHEAQERRKRIIQYLQDPWEAVEPGQAIAEVLDDLFILKEDGYKTIKRMIDKGTLAVERDENGKVNKIWATEVLV